MTMSGKSRLHGRPARLRRGIAACAAACLASVLVGCGGEATGGPITLTYYQFPDPSGALVQTAANCSAASDGRYQIEYRTLPSDADGQRQQLVRRLAAQDTSMDILGIDVIWTAEFAEAGWIREWTGADKRQASRDVLDVALKTATWENKLYAAPRHSQTQLLWYRTDLVPEPPKTWAEMIRMTERLAKQGKPHYAEIQGAQYEGFTVWFNTLLASAGGSVLTEDAQSVKLGEPAVRAAQLLRKFAHSAAADPSLPNQLEDDNRLAMEAGKAAFELNYPFVYPSMKANNPEMFENFAWAPYPAVIPGEPSHVTVGGANLAISAYSQHPEEAFEAALCLRNEKSQKINAVKAGFPPTLESLYDDPQFRKSVPYSETLLATLKTAAVRPITPAYQNVSLVISHQLSPPGDVQPESDIEELRKQISDALQSKGVVP